MTELKTIDLDTMPAGREMDALVAEKVMGAVCSCDTKPRENAYGDSFYCAIHGIDLMGSVRHYSTSITTAWEVVEKLRPGAFHMEYRSDVDDYYVYFVHRRNKGSAFADTAPLAICRASLLVASRREEK